MSAQMLSQEAHAEEHHTRRCCSDYGGTTRSCQQQCCSHGTRSKRLWLPLRSDHHSGRRQWKSYLAVLLAKGRFEGLRCKVCCGVLQH